MDFSPRLPRRLIGIYQPILLQNSKPACLFPHFRKTKQCCPAYNVLYFPYKSLPKKQAFFMIN